MERYILDTNLFFNMEPGLGLGKTTNEVVKRVTMAVQKLKNSKKTEFFMPPRIVDEFLGFFEDKTQSFLKEFLSLITVKSPDVSRIVFPAHVFYKMVNSVRQRSYRGLTIAEEEVLSAAKNAMKNPLEGKKEFEIAVGKHISNLRSRYRNATRTGFLDSVADLDLIVLAKEVDGVVVSADEGVVEWGRIFGVREMDSLVFGKILAGVLPAGQTG